MSDHSRILRDVVVVVDQISSGELLEFSLRFQREDIHPTNKQVRWPWISRVRDVRIGALDGIPQPLAGRQRATHRKSRTPNPEEIASQATTDSSSEYDSGSLSIVKLVKP